MRTYGLRGASLLGTACVLAMVSGCAQMGGLGTTTGQTLANTAGDSPSECNPALGGAIGALAGSMFGKGKGHLAGAAIGAGVGVFACMAYNYHARKLRDAQSVEAQYKREQGALPSTNTIGAYQSELLPGETVKSGSRA